MTINIKIIKFAQTQRVGRRGIRLPMGERPTTRNRDHPGMVEEDPFHIRNGAAESSAHDKEGIIAGSRFLNADMLL